MAVALNHLSQWLWRGKKHQEPKIPNSPSSNLMAETNSWELDSIKFPIFSTGNMYSSSRRIRRKWKSREERKIDKEYDVVIVPSDGECISGSDSDSDSDWSIGWLEPHGSGFQSDDEMDSSFAVLVPCYGRGHREMVEDAKNNILTAIGSIPHSFSPESKKHMEQWLSFLQPSSHQE